MSGNWTSGPWVPGHFADDGHKCDCRYILSENYMGAVATIHVGNGELVGEGGNDAPPLKEAQANARLIAAAPELFEALERTLSWLTSYPGGGAMPVYDQARTALAKAVAVSPLPAITGEGK